MVVVSSWPFNLHVIHHSNLSRRAAYMPVSPLEKGGAAQGQSTPSKVSIDAVLTYDALVVDLLKKSSLLEHGCLI